MRTIISLTVLIISTLNSCSQKNKQDETVAFQYFDIVASDTATLPMLFAVTDEEFLQYGARVAYVNKLGDTIISFGKFTYFGTDTLKYYATVLEKATGKVLGVNSEQKILFDLVTLDNEPDPFSEGLTRVVRSGKMGYANKYGQVVIPCIYQHAKSFNGGRAEVTFKTIAKGDGEYKSVPTDGWFTIDKEGRKIE